MTNEGLEQIRLFVRDSRDEEGEAGEQEPGTRFVVEVDFSRLGPFQFDGLSRRKNIDLIVRTQEKLPDDMRRDISRIYGDTVTALGVAGTIAFQVTPAFELNPLHDISGDSRDITI
jgi:hypothetical protein